MTTSLIAVAFLTPEQGVRAQQLADQLQLPLLASPESEEAKTYTYLLLVTPSYVGLQKTADKKLAPFYIDFLCGKMLYRVKQAGLRKELLARAMGLKPSDYPRIIDATAGLGRDSFILASLGFQVTLMERSPILHALLQDALERARQDSSLSPIIDRMQLLHKDAINALKQCSPPPHIIYLDPMFPERQKSASVKKDMAFMQHLLGKDEDANQLFEQALACACYRVVVKRPRLAGNLAERKPSFSLLGKSSRFDIYLTPQDKLKTER